MYLSKKAVLEWLNENIKDQDWPYEIRYAFKHVREKIQSGAFDADGEIQRLRAAAIKLHETINSFWQGDCDKADVVAAQSKLCDVLSTTAEPTNAAKVERVRELWNITKQRVDEPEDYLQQEYFAGKAIGIMDTLNALGIKILGINAPEKEGQTE